MSSVCASIFDICFTWPLRIKFWIYVFIFNLSLSILSTSSSNINFRVKRSDSLPNFRIISGPKQLSVLEHDTVVLPCRVDKSENIVVMWKKGKNQLLFAGNVSVVNNDNHKFELVDQTSLQINSVTAEFAGEYSCFLNGKPEITLTHELRVLIPPKIVLDHDEKHIIVKKGDFVSAKCTAEGYPEPVITWKALKGSLPGGIREKQGKFLNITSADIHHSGTYECSADNGVRSPEIAYIRIKVLYAPEIHVTPEWVHAGIGSIVELQCTAISQPTSTMFWIRNNDDVLTEDEDISFQNIQKSPTEEQLILKLKRITRDKLGSYSCFANNSLGSATRTVKISGLAEPVRFRSNTTGDQKDSFLLSWTVKSYSRIIEYLLRVRQLNTKDSTWTDIMIPVEDEQSIFHSRNYNITGLQGGEAYEVVMQARNDFGWNHPSDAFIFHTLSDSGMNKDTTFKQKSENIIKSSIPLETKDNQQEKSRGNSNFCHCIFFIFIFSPYMYTIIVES